MHKPMHMHSTKRTISSSFPARCTCPPLPSHRQCPSSLQLPSPVSNSTPGPRLWPHPWSRMVNNTVFQIRCLSAGSLLLILLADTRPSFCLLLHLNCVTETTPPHSFRAHCSFRICLYSKQPTALCRHGATLSAGPTTSFKAASPTGHTVFTSAPQPPPNGFASNYCSCSLLYEPI